MFDLTKSELGILKKLSTPAKIQDFLDQIPLNWEKDGETNLSPRMVLRENRAHCIEGAMLASVALWLQGKEPLLLDLKTIDGDDHVVALFKQGGRWGAISKTNHANLRYRDPVYMTVRELAMSYFHEYYSCLSNKKTLRSHSLPFNMKKLGTGWITAEENLDYIAELLDTIPHRQLFSKKSVRFLRQPDRMELRSNELREWSEDNIRMPKEKIA